jgi:GWxTD domain-containing protein
MTRSYEGHPPGGPFICLLLAAALGACLPSALPNEDPEPITRSETFIRLGDSYQRLGFITGPPSYSAVAGFARLAGPADSTIVIYAMSLPANALRFQRDDAGFFAEYSVELHYVRDGTTAARVQSREAVRVANFAETTRGDETVVFQAMTSLAPGRYEVQIRSNDAHSSRGFRAVDTIDVPRFGASGLQLSPPILVLEAEGRAARDAIPAIVASPRRALSYGGAAARVYVEAYDTAPVPVQLRVMDEFGEVVWFEENVIQSRDGIGHMIFDVPGDRLPLGRLSVQAVSARESTEAGPLVLTITDQWLVGSFEEVVQFLRYIATPAEIDSLVAAPAAARRARWDAFWASRDPFPTAPGNEFRDEFFRRVRIAAESYSDGGRPGWRTDRGEVFIVLGPPDRAQERFLGRGGDAGLRPTGLEWIYENTPVGRLSLVFVDRSGFGRYELVPASHAAFRNAAERLRLRTVGGDQS